MGWYLNFYKINGDKQKIVMLYHNKRFKPVWYNFTSGIIGTYLEYDYIWLYISSIILKIGMCKCILYLSSKFSMIVKTNEYENE